MVSDMVLGSGSCGSIQCLVESDVGVLIIICEMRKPQTTHVFVLFVFTSHLETISYFIVQVNQSISLYLSSFLLFGEVFNFKFSCSSLLMLCRKRNKDMCTSSVCIPMNTHTHYIRMYTHTHTLTLAL